MKKLLTVLFLLSALFVCNVYAQEEATQKEEVIYPNWYVDFSLGGRLGKMNTSSPDFKANPAGFNVNLGVRFMFKDVSGLQFLDGIGLKLDYAFDGASAKYNENNQEKTTRAVIYRISGQGVADINYLFPLGVENLGLLFHTGFGLSLLSNSDVDLKDSFDNMFNYIVGVTPEYKITDNLKAQLDLSYIFLGKQDKFGIDMRRYDLSGNKLKSGKQGDGYMNISVGVTYGF